MKRGREENEVVNTSVFTRFIVAAFFLNLLINVGVGDFLNWLAKTASG